MVILNVVLSLSALFLLVYFNYAVFIRQFYDLQRLLILYRKKVKQWFGTYSFYSFFLIIGCSILWSILFGRQWGLLYFNIYLLIIGWSTKKEKVLFTRRSIFQLVAISILFSVLIIVYIYLRIAYYIAMPILLACPFIIIAISYYLEWPVESIVRHKYLRSARQKLSLNPELIIIGITGSFGKTSFKKALFTLLSEKYRVIKSPGSVNTLMGLTKFINNELTPYEEIVILECGVDKPGGMDKLLKLFRPQIAIITAIGEMHLATFKNIATIKKEKLKLADAVSKTGKVFFQINENLSTSDFHCLSQGYSLIEECPITEKGSEIHLTYLGKEIKMTINLFGKHQVENVIGAIQVAEYLGLSVKELARGLAKLHPEPQRLSLRQINDRLILDDAYNSNERGLKEAISVLKQFPRPLAIITPGVIELDNAYETVNQRLGTYLVDIDVIYIITPEKDKVHPLIKGYINSGGNMVNVIVKENFSAAYLDFLTKEVKSLLIANDTSKTFIK